MGDGEERQETAYRDPGIVLSIAAATAVTGLGVVTRYAMRSTALSLMASLSSPLAVTAVAGLGGAAVAGLGGAAVGRLGVAAWNAYTASSSSPSPLDVPCQERTYHQKRTFRFNVDASQDPHATNKAGIGGVLKNENGKTLYELCEPLELEDDINIAELTAIKRALQVFSNNRSNWFGLYDELIVANDNETAVRLAKGEQSPFNNQISDLAEEIQTLVSAIGEVGFIKVGENDIREADELANQGRMNNF